VYEVILTVTDFDGDMGNATVNINTQQNHVITSRGAVYASNVIVINENIQPGDFFTTSYSFKNTAGEKLKDVSVSSSIPELGIYARAKKPVLRSGDTMSGTLVLQAPVWAPSGYYYVRTTISTNSGNIRRTIYREVRIR